MTNRRALTGQFGPFLLAFGLAAPLAALSGRLAPMARVSSFEVGNDFVAMLGLSFAAIQFVAHRRSSSMRMAWSCAALGCATIAFEDHLEAILSAVTPSLLEATISGVLWTIAASLILVCGRRHAMRRHVMVAMRVAASLAIFAVGLNMSLHLAGVTTGRHSFGKIEDAAELASSVSFLVGLVLTQIAAEKSYRMRSNEIGVGARALFYDFALERRRRYPTVYPILALPVFRHLLTLAMIAWFFPVASGAVRRAYGVGVRRQLLDLIRVGFVHGIDAKSYYVQELYRDEPGLIAASMTRVETKNGLTKAIQSLRADAGGARDLNDKLEFWRVCEEHGVPSAPILATVKDGALIRQADPDAFDRDLFIKERKGRGGRLTLNFERVGRFLYRDDDGATVNLEEIVQRVQAIGGDRQLLVQPKLSNHPSIATLADASLVVFRVMTCMDEHGRPHVTHGVMRLLRRFEPNWPKTPDADWGCAIDLETGEFGLLTGDAPQTCTSWFADHPVTGERVSGRVLEGWKDIAEVALAAHRVFAARTVIGWDIGWTPDGPVILEGNSNTDFSYFQRVYRTPVGRSPLGPLLNAHLNALATRLQADASEQEPSRASGKRDASSARRAEARIAVDRFFERGMGGRLAGALADARFAAWRRSQPGGTYAQFYAHRANRTLDRGRAHKTLGLRHYRADPVSGSIVHQRQDFAERGLRYFRWFEERGLRSDMVCVDFGCGSLRVGQHFIRRLDPFGYIGLDVVDRFFEDGLTLIEPKTLEAKRPRLSVIDKTSLDFAARRSPDLIFSTAVLQHVPPAELDAYFGAIVAMMAENSVAAINFKRSPSTVRIGSSAWAQSEDDLLASVGRVDATALVRVVSLPTNPGDDYAQGMLVIAKTLEVLAPWAGTET